MFSRIPFVNHTTTTMTAMLSLMWVVSFANAFTTSIPTRTVPVTSDKTRHQQPWRSTEVFMAATKQRSSSSSLKLRNKHKHLHQQHHAAMIRRRQQQPPLNSTTVVSAAAATFSQVASEEEAFLARRCILAEQSPEFMFPPPTAASFSPETAAAPPPVEQVLQYVDDDDDFASYRVQKAAIASSDASTDREDLVDNDASDAEREILFARLLLLGAAALYGTNFSLVKLLGQSDLPIGISSALRFGMAALATSPWLLAPDPSAAAAAPGDCDGSFDARGGRPLPSFVESLRDAVSCLSRPDDVVCTTAPALAATLAGMEVGLLNSVGYVAQAVGLETTAASTSAFLCSLAVVVVPVLDCLVGKWLSSRQVVGLVAALAGVAMLELGGDGAGGGGDAASAATFTLSGGDLASLMQPLFFGLGFWRMERAMHQYPEHADRCTAGQLLAVFMGSAIYCAATWREETRQAVGGLASASDATLEMLWQQMNVWLSDPVVWMGLFWTGVVSTALTIYMETVALKTLCAAETTLIFSTEPLWGTAFAAAVMGEQLGTDAAMGAALIVGGCLFSNLGMEGIQSLLFKSKDKDKDNSNAKKEQSATTSGFSLLDTMRNTIRTNKHARFTKATMFAALHPWWNNMSVATKVLAMEVQDVVQDALAVFDP